jgi:hypothetical protein
MNDCLDDDFSVCELKLFIFSLEHNLPVGQLTTNHVLHEYYSDISPNWTRRILH